MISKSEIFEVLESEEERLDSYGVERLGVFGSFSREDQTGSSDIDFLVEFSEGEKTYRNYIGLKRFLEEVFGREVDLVTEESLKPSMRDSILGEVEYAEEA
jgi:predicted nucleotidyltransferase